MPAVPPTPPEDQPLPISLPAALRLANFIFGEAALASRLSNRVRGTEGLSYTVNARLAISPQDKDASFTMFAICNPTNIDKVEKAIKEELAKMHKEGVSETELAEAKKAYLEADIYDGDFGGLATAAGLPDR